MKVPVPVPFEVFVPRATVGFAPVLQQTPRAVTGAPPSDVTFPPLVAVADEVAEVVPVVTTGATTSTGVVNVNSFPYPGPALFIA